VTVDVTAAQRMDRIYRNQRHIYDLTRKYFLLGRDRLIERLDVGPGGTVLEIGCGTGRNLIVAARHYPRSRFFGIDISSAMLASATKAIGRAQLSSRVVVALADATRFDPLEIFGEDMFARVFLSYSLSMIPAWQAVLDSAMRLLGASGELHVIDFGCQENLPSWFGKGLRSWLSLFEVAPRDGLERTLMSLAAEVGARVTVERPYGGYAQYATVRWCGTPSR
jgi:S-adenosylmethionine-diacylgycerolhomoserine-N-methlytransferase